MTTDKDGQTSNSSAGLPTRVENTGASGTPPKPQEQIEDEIEIGPPINGCHNPIKTSLAKGNAMASIVKDLEISRTQKQDKNYIWGTIANGLVLSVYLKYAWGPQEGDSKTDKELKAAGARWLERRTPEQKHLLERCQTLARKFAGDPDREITEMLFMISEPGSLGQEGHMDMEHNNGDYIVFIMFTKGYKTQWMTTEKELKINSFMDIPTEWNIEEEQQPLEPGDAFALMPSLPHRAPAHPSSNEQGRIVLMMVFASKPSDEKPIFLQEHRDKVQAYTEEQEKNRKSDASQTEISRMFLRRGRKEKVLLQHNCAEMYQRSLRSEAELVLRMFHRTQHRNHTHRGRYDQHNSTNMRGMLCMREMRTTETPAWTHTTWHAAPTREHRCNTKQ